MLNALIMAVLTSLAGLVATITEAGLTNLTLNGTPVLVGGLSAENASAPFGITGETSLGAVTNSFVLASNATSVVVLQAHAKARVQYVYTLAGEDVNITATIKNSTGAPITVLGFKGLLGTWTAGDATGLLGNPTMDAGVVGIAYFHPSNFTPIGAAYRIPTGAPFGVCVYPVNLGMVQSLVHCGQATPSIDFYVAPSRFRFPASSGTTEQMAGQAPVASSGIHPGETYTVSFGIRVSADVTWQHLLAPYKAQFNATFGPCTYAAARDDRPICMSFPGDAATLDPTTNPYGFNGWGGFPGVRYRFDLDADPWCDTVLPSLVAAGCQGVIFWSLNGWDTRFPGVDGGGINYNSDVHILPLEVAANVPTLLARVQAESRALGRGIGYTGYVRTRRVWDGDGLYPVSSASADQLIDYLARWDVAIAAGFTLFYLDTFPSSFNEHRLLQALRAHWGGTILTYSEFTSDVALVYSGFYIEIAAGPPYATSQELIIARWITPHTSVAVKDTTGANHSTGILDFIYQNQLTPFVQDQTLVAESGTIPARLASYNATYLVANQFPVS